MGLLCIREFRADDVRRGSTQQETWIVIKIGRDLFERKGKKSSGFGFFFGGGGFRRVSLTNVSYSHLSGVDD